MNKIQIKKNMATVFYYCLILTGLLLTSWIIWNRFIRERTIRDIPDILFTELRFWILLYICFIYLYVIKNLIKPKETNKLFSQIIDQLYLPMTTLDNFIKYNKYIYQHYSWMMLKIIDYLDLLKNTTIKMLLYFFRVFPRSILVIFLLLDTFYFNRIELFYKVILIGLLPFAFRYFKYSLKDVYDYWINELESKYEFACIFEKGYENEISRIHETQAEFHYTTKTIKEYIEIKYNNWIAYNGDKVSYQYIANPLCKEHIYKQYALKKSNNRNVELTSEDFDLLHNLFYQRIPVILNLRVILQNLQNIEDERDIKYIKIVIFSLYFICWSFILIVSYYHYPVEFNLLKFFVRNLTTYLCARNDSFSMKELQSQNDIIAMIIKYIISKL